MKKIVVFGPREGEGPKEIVDRMISEGIEILLSVAGPVFFHPPEIDPGSLIKEMISRSIVQRGERSNLQLFFCSCGSRSPDKELWDLKRSGRVTKRDILRFYDEVSRRKIPEETLKTCRGATKNKRIGIYCFCFEGAPCHRGLVLEEIFDRI